MKRVVLKLDETNHAEIISKLNDDKSIMFSALESYKTKNPTPPKAIVTFYDVNDAHTFIFEFDDSYCEWFDKFKAQAIPNSKVLLLALREYK